ncbi:hypothetical protein [Stakelama tenebrarum]|uniref:Uncharacterized protein n=1 Tax=Stakelama tenebrarum TaxID=2711215 RepID=A0A6G6Y9S1_9SPHN|nr:hypothetical protein [Sphingosinithalassobacter tenebrarum]QIG81591.1 hypothetical protein G5C33_18560 [Sphingosinithalassobacter tenebrarum]
MAATFFYLESPGAGEVLQWFRSLPARPVELQADGFIALHFESAGALVLDQNRRIDPKQSSVVTLFEPGVVRDARWTVGEVHFLSQHIRQRFPSLAHVQTRFAKWLRGNRIVWDQRSSEADGFGYFLEGGIKNLAERIYALPSGSAAYDAGRYLIGHHESEIALDRICKSLRLRGVEC